MTGPLTINKVIGVITTIVAICGLQELIQVNIQSGRSILTTLRVILRTDPLSPSHADMSPPSISSATFSLVLNFSFSLTPRSTRDRSIPVVVSRQNRTISKLKTDQCASCHSGEKKRELVEERIESPLNMANIHRIVGSG